MLERFPFLILILGGFLAGASAVLLRRAASVYGAWLGTISLAASFGAAVVFLAAFYWALSMATATPPPIAVSLAGWGLALAGGLLAGWGLRVRGFGPLRVWRVDRFEQRLPFRLLRRPIELGAMAAAAGLAILRNAPTVWVCLAAWILVWNIMLELGDWELRQRLPTCRDYMRRTPRYIPRLPILPGRRPLRHSS